MAEEQGVGLMRQEEGPLQMVRGAGLLPVRPVVDLATMKRIKAEWEEYLRDQLKPGVDTYQFEGYAKEALSKAGGENLIKSAGLVLGRIAFLERVERFDDPAFFHYIMQAEIVDSLGRVRGVGVGSANSHESKWRWRWVPEARVPSGLALSSLEQRDGTASEFAFAIDKAETGGKYGKPAAYWQAFKDEIKAGTAKKVTRKTKAGKDLDAWEIGSKLYRVPNDDVASIQNTIIKMCKKRAMIDGALSATGMSDRYTQREDDEDDDKGVVIDGEVIPPEKVSETDVTPKPIRFEEAFPKMQAEEKAAKKAATPAETNGPPSQEDKLRIRIVELASALDWPPAKLQGRCYKLVKAVDIDKMGFEDLGRVAAMLVEEQAQAGAVR